MAATIYFSKINLNSHILQVYKDEDCERALREVCNIIISRFNDKIEYIREAETYRDEEGTVHTYDATYSTTSIVKHDGEYNFAISGAIHKESYIYYKVMEEEGKLVQSKVKNSELINFYYDVYREIVCFYTTSRFGYTEFNEAFKGILNKAMYQENLPEDEQYYFNVELYKQALTIDSIKEELKKIGKIKSLRIAIKAPNANKTLLRNISKNPEKIISEMQDGNVTEKSILLTSNAPAGLNLDNEAVSQGLDEIKNIHTYLTDTEALRNGYAEVEAEAHNGYQYTTKTQKPFKRNISDKQKFRGEFITVCKEAISSLFL